MKGTTKTVISPIVFTLKVTETQDQLDLISDTLQRDHITDPQQLEEIQEGLTLDMSRSEWRHIQYTDTVGAIRLLVRW